jgi:ABC-type bacteriocin/lantibiotic exporter with double-glycine peptidase domain
MHGRTTLMIAHRPSTLSRFDLLAMENGRSSTLSTPASSGGEWVAQPASWPNVRDA